MLRSRLLLGVAAVLAGTSVLLVVLGFAYTPVLLLAAAPFAVAAGFLWWHATGRLEVSMRAQIRYERVESGDARRTGRDVDGMGSADRESGAGRSQRQPGPDDWADSPALSLSRREAARVLDVSPEADAAAVRDAFRDRAREVHPDAPGGDAEAFREARAAYERLRPDR